MPARPRAQLRVVGGAQDGQTFPLAGGVGATYSLGRALDNAICLKDTETSRHHATISFDGVDYTVVDNRSTNGTFVNGAFTPRTALHHGDRLRLGDTMLIFERLGAEDRTSAAASETIRFVTAEEEPNRPTPGVNVTLAVADRAALMPEPPAENVAELRTAHEQLQILHRINQAVASSGDLQTMLETIMEELRELKPFDRGFIMLYNAQGELEPRVEYHANRGGDVITVSSTVIDQAVREGMAVLCSDMLSNPRFAASDSVHLTNTQSVMCVPLVANGEVLGVLHVDSQSVEHAFTEQDLRLFSIIGNDLAIALANERMRERLLRRQQIERDLEIASQIQQQLLPEHVPQDPNIRLYARNVPAYQVGGDFYDYFPLGDHRMGVVIGDVSGKGVTAALLMVKAMAEFRALASDHRDSTAAVVGAANGILAARSMRGMFITLAYLLIDTAAMTLTYTNAGHLPPLLVHADGSDATLDGAAGTPLGIAADVAYPEEQIALRAGDTCVLLTDGFIEARNAAKQEMTLDRVRAAARANAGGPQELVEALLAETLAFVGQAPQHDDLTALALRVG